MSKNQLSPEQEAEAQALAKRIQEISARDVLEIARVLVSKEPNNLFGKTEFEVRDLVHRIGAKAFDEHLREKKNGYEGSGVICCHCAQSARFVGYRPIQPLSILGAVHCQRAYYHCARCGTGMIPWDEQVGLTRRMTPGAAELTTLAGTLNDSFAEAAEIALPKMSGLRIAETTVQRVSEGTGKRLGELLTAEHTLGTSASWQWHRDAHGHTCAYVSLDATTVHQQAPGGGAAEGRMPYVGMVFNPVPELPANSPYQPPPRATMQARYLAGLYSLEELGLQLRRQAGQVGMAAADVWIGLTDGGQGLENFLRVNFPRNLVLILDFWHAAEYLGELAGAWYGNDDAQVKMQLEQWCHTMKHQGGQGILEKLTALELPMRRPQVREKYEAAVHYIANNVHRMDYPTYVANGWFIGSGSIESACKTVVGQRLKLAGMRWGEDGTDEICHLRALLKSESNQWEAFWDRSIN
jgi:hypothetical protein